MLLEREVPPYAVHNDVAVKGFFGRYFFLSNMYPCLVSFDGMTFPASENAYQSCKVDGNYQHLFTGMDPKESKKKWKQFTTPYTEIEWDALKYDLMAAIVFEKFYQNVELRSALLATGTKHLEEYNNWGDEYWGVSCRNDIGKNKLGQILMKVRAFWNPDL